MTATLVAALVLSGVVEARLAESESPACVAVALVAAKTETAFGCTPGIAGTKPDERSIFEIGSITKGFTGLILADMVRKGEVSLDDSVTKYSRPGAKLPVGAEAITLRDVVTQTSGLPRMPPVFKPANPHNPYADFTADTLYEALAQTELKERGKYEYSNFGFMWLSEMLARRAGKSYEALVKERVLGPLGMTDTAVNLNDDQAKRFVTGHNAAYQPVAHWEVGANLEGVGALRAPLADMAKLAEALARRRDTPLKETIAVALEPIRPSQGNFTGYAWITTKRGSTRVHWHSGGTAGFHTMIAVNPDTRTAAVVLVDSSTSFNDLAMHLVDPDTPLIRKRVGLATDPDTLKQYAGRYELSPAFAIEVFVEGAKLMAQATAQQAFEVLREGTDVFFYTVVPARLRFARGADGQVDGLTLEQGGRELKGKRSASAR
ncbi:MAG TPA: serine hydrolase [Usitatibacter sp.]|nr:serine hydrolase [Usitatibacter sp.]